MQYHHPQFDESVNVTRTHPLKAFLGYALAVFLLIGALYYASSYAVELAVPHVSERTERWIWNAVFKESYTVKDEARTPPFIETEQYLQTLLDRIPKDGLPAFEYKVILYPEDAANAFALPGGKIIVNTGLLPHITTENGMVFVLGHELGHFAHRDHLRGMGRTLLTGVVMAPFVMDHTVAGLFQGIGAGFDTHFSRQQESQADEHGLHALAAVYGHAGGATEFFDFVHTHGKESTALKYMSTHPMSRDRIERLHGMIDREQWPVGATTPIKTKVIAP